MIVALLAAASISAHAPAATAPDPAIIEDAAHAIDRGRLREAKLLIVRAITGGARGSAIDRLNADLAFASDHYVEALSAFQRLAGSAEKQQSDCEKGAIAALKLGRFDDAKPLVDCAVSDPAASWRAWNAQGVLADAMRDWAVADEAFAHARTLAPDEASIVNNEGWSKLVRGEWSEAVPLFQQAAGLDPKSERIANNLELASAALAADLPQRRAGESDRDWAVRLNDAGVAAELLGDRQRALAAFTQALDASPTWYGRASNNLQVLSQN
jgi:Flp pilus assembly protein TadD